MCVVIWTRYVQPTDEVYLLLAFSEVRSLPQHVCQQIKEEQQHELREKERQEWERNLCKVITTSLCPSTAYLFVCEVSCVHATPYYWRHGREED